MRLKGTCAGAAAGPARLSLETVSHLHITLERVQLHCGSFVINLDSLLNARSSNHIIYICSSKIICVSGSEREADEFY